MKQKHFLAGALAALLLLGTMAGCEKQGNESSQPEVSQPASSASSAQESNTSSAVDAEFTYSGGLTETGYFKDIKALELVTLPDYQKHEVPQDVSTISDDAVQSELESRMSAFQTTEQVKDRAVKDGDTVNIDYVGSVDGVEFEGGNTGGNGTTVTIGVTSYIDDFLEQLIGHKPGDTFDVNVTFPTPYENNEDLSGKDAVFVTTVNYIEEEKTPELNDAFVTEHWKEDKGWSTVTEAKEGVREELRKSAVQDYLFDWLMNNAEFKSVPDSVYQYQVGTMLGYYQIMAERYGMTVEDLLKSMEIEGGEEGLKEQNKESLEKNARVSLLLQALSEELNIVPKEEDIKAYMKRTVGTEDYAEIEKMYGRPYLMLVTREDMVKLKLGEL